MIRLILRMMNLMPYNPILARAIQEVAYYLQDGPALTRYGYWIDYTKTGRFATTLRTLVISGSYERPYFEMLKRLMKPGDIALDVGAHEGYVALWLSKLVGGEVFAVEPNPENLMFLRNNIKLNPETNIKVIEKAVSDEKGRTDFYCSPDAGANGSLIPFSYFSENRIEVEVDTLDSLFGNLERLDFLKVDTEGNELKVLMGARQLLERCRPQICFEVNLTFGRILNNQWICCLIFCET